MMNHIHRGSFLNVYCKEVKNVYRFLDPTPEGYFPGSTLIQICINTDLYTCIRVYTGPLVVPMSTSI